MAQEYKITKVSEQEPRQYDGQYGTVYYHKVMLEGHKKPVAIGKKTLDKPNVGDVLYGTIKDNPDYDEDGFKAEKKPFVPNTKTFGKSPEEQHNIMRMNALNNALVYAGVKASKMEVLKIDTSDILKNADDFYEWLILGEALDKDSGEEKEKDF